MTAITACQRRQGTHVCLWNGALVDTVDATLFDPAVWAARGRLVGMASGRGQASFVQRDDGSQWVLRHSRRGGLVAHISEDAYIWLGRAACRVFREWHLLAELHDRGLPVPLPVAAHVERRGAVYRGDLITVRVPAAQPLAQWLAQAPLTVRGWQGLGAVVARFHRAGVYHHDLNARNILIDDAGDITLIDFDKSRLRSSGRWPQRNLARLRRSLDKIAAARPGLHFSETDWQALLTGYAESSE